MQAYLWRSAVILTSCRRLRLWWKRLRRALSIYIEVRSRVEQPKYPILKIQSPGTPSQANDAAAQGPVGKPIRRAERSAERKDPGSSVVFDVREGLIVTNNHVIQGADRITVTLSDG
jgi:S1-C subfamily serine protease